MSTRNVIFLLVALLFFVVVPALTAPPAAAQDAKEAADLKTAVSEFDAGMAALEKKEYAEAITHFDNVQKILTPTLAVELLGAKGHEAFDRLYNEGGEFRKFARIISETAARESHRRQTDPKIIKKLVDDFLTGKGSVVSEAYRDLKYKVGEFSVQPLIDAWHSAPNSKIKAGISIVLQEMGSRITLPLIEALATEDPVLKHSIIDALRTNKDWRAAPALLALSRDTTQTEEIRKAAGEAAAVIIKAIVPSAKPESMDPADLYLMVAEDYFAARIFGPRAVIPRYSLGEDYISFMWTWEKNKLAAEKLAPFSVNEDMAMRLATKALKLKPNCAEAYALLVACNLAKIAEGEGLLELDRLQKKQLLTDAARSDINAALDNARHNHGWIFSGGERSLYDALALSVKHNRRAVAISCMNKIIETHTGKTVKALPRTDKQIGDKACYASPLIECLNSRNSVIAFKAAITLAKISPGAAYPGVEKAASALISAMKEAGTVNVLVVHRQQEVRNALKATFTSMGYVTTLESNFTSGLNAARDLPIPDFIVLDNDLDEGTIFFLRNLRDNTLTRSTPVLIVSDVKSAERDGKRFKFESVESVKGIITDYADPEQIKKLSAGLKKADNVEDALFDTIVEQASEIIAELKPGESVIDLAKSKDGILEIAMKAARPQTRLAAIAALGNWRIKEALAPLMKVFTEKSAPMGIRLAAGKSASMIISSGDDVSAEIFGLLKSSLADPRHEIRSAVADILAQAPLSSDQKKTLVP